MRMKKIIFSLILGTLACLTACNKVEPPVLATAVTMDEVTMDAIHCSATVVEGDISDCGFYYGTAKSNVTGRKSKKVQGTYDAGLIKAIITDLDPNTTYYVRAYAINKKGTVRYFGFTETENPVPNLPVFKSVRIDKDLDE